MMLEAIIILGGLGILFGVGLYVTSKVFYVRIDPRIEVVEKILPGTNCGACGFAGCSGFAKAIVHGSADVSGCVAGGEEVSHNVADVLGVDKKEVEKKIAVLMCNGRNVADRYEYVGVRDCRSANLLQGGPKACLFGCIGYGDCANVCPFDALHMIEGFPVVDDEKCKSCGKCIDACPKGLFVLLSTTNMVHVRCRSHDSAKITRSVCKIGCIACKRCEKECPFDAIHVVDNLAVIDYEKCTSCGKCVDVCPTKTITNVRKE